MGLYLTLFFLVASGVAADIFSVVSGVAIHIFIFYSCTEVATKMFLVALDFSTCN